jgi:hypothetical protein
MFQSVRGIAIAALAVAALAVGVTSAPSVQAAGGVPAPAKAPKPGILFAPLTGPAIGLLVPFGHARYRTLGVVRDFIASAAPVNLPDGTVLNLSLNGSPLTTMTVLLGVARSPLLATDLGMAVPFILRGDQVTVTDAAGAIVLSGTF